MSVLGEIDERNKVIQIIMQNMGIIHKVANMFCKSQEDKDDLVQEIMTQLWSSFEKYDDAYKLGTWMYRVSLNIAISFYRKKQTQEQYFMPLDEKLDIISNDENENEVETNNLELLTIKTYYSKGVSSPEGLRSLRSL